MSKIIKLDKKLANQIAAGEVVERPISVVKELVENSIDANSTYIKVEIISGGVQKIIITDNGEGIEKDDLELVLEKYSTSKIKTIEDLYNIMTFGFRGEALASISSVSQFELISKYKSSDYGYILTMLDGENKNIEKHPSEIGTKIIVNNLFYNTPARLNYLKKVKTEYSHIFEFLNQISLSYPKIGFEFISDGKTIFKYQENEDLITRIYSIYGEEVSQNLLNIDFSLTGLNISGYISDPKVSFANKNKQSLFINNRIVKSPIIYKAIFDAYNRFIPHSNFPGYVLNLKIDPTLIDVNVHPRKMEVRFANEQEIYRAFYNSIESKLSTVSLISNNFNYNLPKEELTYLDNKDYNLEKTDNLNNKYYTGSGNKFKSYSPYKDISHNPNQAKILDSINFSKELLKPEILEGFSSSNDLHETKLGKIIGQTFNSYIIVETQNSLKILDQHALAERIIYEKLLKNQYKEKVQGLLFSQIINLTPIENDILGQNKEVFLNMGFDFEILPTNQVELKGIPDFIKNENLQDILLGILDDISDLKLSKSITLQEIRNKIFAYTSCRSAVKFGNRLNLFEINKLLNDSILDYSSTCPHGRPVIYEIDLNSLKNKYER